MHGFGTSVAAEDDDDDIPFMLAVPGWRSVQLNIRSARDGWRW